MADENTRDGEYSDNEDVLLDQPAADQHSAFLDDEELNELRPTDFDAEDHTTLTVAHDGSNAHGDRTVGDTNRSSLFSEDPLDSALLQTDGDSLSAAARVGGLPFGDSVFGETPLDDEVNSSPDEVLSAPSLLNGQPSDETSTDDQPALVAAHKGSRATSLSSDASAAFNPAGQEDLFGETSGKAGSSSNSASRFSSDALLGNPAGDTLGGLNAELPITDANSAQNANAGGGRGSTSAAARSSGTSQAADATTGTNAIDDLPVEDEDAGQIQSDSENSDDVLNNETSASSQGPIGTSFQESGQSSSQGESSSQGVSESSEQNTSENSSTSEDDEEIVEDEPPVVEESSPPPDVNDGPATSNVSASGAEDAASISVTLTGSDVDGSVDSFSLSSLPSDGTLYTDAGLTTVAATGTDYTASGGSLTLYFVPDGNFNGDVTFDYAATDDDGAVDATPATATITVTEVVDTITGTAGDDILTGTMGTDVINGLGGNDTIDGGGGADTIDGGTGSDTVSYDGSSAAVNVNLSTGTGTGGDAQGDTLTNIENLTGTTKNDTLTGDGNANVIDGGRGKDEISTGAGDDVIIFDTQDTLIEGGADTDTLQASGNINLNTFSGTINGIEQIDLTADAGGNSLTLSAQDVIDISDNNVLTITGDANDNFNAGNGWTDGGLDDNGNQIYTQVVGSNTAVLVIDPNISVNSSIESGGGGGTNPIIGDINDNNLVGTAGDDLIIGQAGDDTVSSGDGDDLIQGQMGDDSLQGGLGDDTIEGGHGDDTFLFTDTDFNGSSWVDVVDGQGTPGETPMSDYDTIDLSGVTQGWTLEVDGAGPGSEANNGDPAGEYVSGGEMSGTITFDDGSTAVFDNIEKIDW